MMSLVTIAKRLTEIGIPTPSIANGRSIKQRKAKGWSSVMIRQFFISETYCGVWRYRTHIGRGGKDGKRPIEEQIAVNVPAIITRETWEIAQAQRAYNSKMSKRKMKREYLLRGLIRCGCGRAMVGGASNGKHHYYYYCPRRYACGSSVGDELCKEPLVKGMVIESITWDYIIRLITNPEQFERKLREAQAQEAVTMRPKEKELVHVIALLKETENEADEIARVIRKVKGIVAKKMRSQSDEIDRRFRALQIHKSNLEKELKVELTDRNIDNLLEFREAVSLGLENPTFEDKRRCLEILQAKVAVSNGIAIVTCRLGGKPFSIELFGYKTSKRVS